MNKQSPVITKDHFVACIEVLREADDMARRINKAVDKHQRSDFINGYGFLNSDTETKLIETLELALGDEEHWISWLCLEADYGRKKDFKAEVTFKGESYNINSPEALYDFLTQR